MSAGTLPPHITYVLERLTEGVSRNEVARRAAAMSANYRSGGSSILIKDRADALAYALARMPATYAAVSACLAALREADETFAPESLLDVGAGPGTATWAARQAFDSLSQLALLDANPALRDLALDIGSDGRVISTATYRLGDATVGLKSAAEADLVVSSYAIGELQAAQRAELVERMWAKTRSTLLIVEPGTPDGYDRIIAARSQLIAAGATIVAPCPHDLPCPLRPPDWCHFAQRLSRSRDHMYLKDADVPFEDEKFSYVAVARIPPATRGPRVLAPPMQTKTEIAAKLCMPDGTVRTSYVARRDKPAFASARRWRWGDAIEQSSRTGY